jgi:aquaporin related protein
MMVSGALPWVRGALLFSAQIAGGIIAAGLNTCMLPGPIAVITTLSARTSVHQGLFIESFLISLLVSVILMLAAEKHATTRLAPVGIGLSLFAAELAGQWQISSFICSNWPSFAGVFFHRRISQPSQKLWAIGGHK